MSQTSYPTQAALGFPGMLGDPNSDAHIRSLANEDAADADFGLGYAQGTDPEKQFEAFAAADTFAGVLVHRHQTQNTAIGAIEQDEPGDIMTKGRVWVTTNELVVAGEPAFVVNAVADFGQFRNDATNAQAVSGVFRQVASATLALLELNEP